MGRQNEPSGMSTRPLHGRQTLPTENSVPQVCLTEFNEEVLGRG